MSKVTDVSVPVLSGQPPFIRCIQTVGEQFERDDQVLELSSIIEDAYAYVGTTYEMRGLTKPLETYIEVTLRQTVECAIFIRQYCGRGFGGTFYYVCGQLYGFLCLAIQTTWPERLLQTKRRRR